MSNKSYAPGMLDQLVRLRRAVNTSDGMGGNTQAWSDVATIWAHIRPLSGGEVVQRERQEQHVNYLCVVRTPLGVLPDDVIAWDGHELNVRAIKVTPRSLYLELECELGAAQ